MKVFFDTSVLVASVVQIHESHSRAYDALDRVHQEKDEGHISAHSLAEMYAVLTKLPPPSRHTPQQALLSTEENVIKYFKVSSLATDDYTTLIREAAIGGIQGGTIYDAILLKCAAKIAAERILTLNLKHFQNIAPRNIGSKVFVP